MHKVQLKVRSFNLQNCNQTKLKALADIASKIGLPVRNAAIRSNWFLKLFALLY
jgi:hypothetical protein